MLYCTLLGHGYGGRGTGRERRKVAFPEEEEKEVVEKMEEGRHTFTRSSSPVVMYLLLLKVL